jgi:hypothetical protein
MGKEESKQFVSEQSDFDSESHENRANIVNNKTTCTIKTHFTLSKIQNWNMVKYWLSQYNLHLNFWIMMTYRILHVMSCDVMSKIL